MENTCCWYIWQTQFSVRLLSRSALTFVCTWYQVYTCFYTGKPLVNLALSFLVLYQRTCQSKDFIQCKMCKLVLTCSVFWLIRVVFSSGFLIAMLSVFLDATATTTWCDERHCRNVFVPCIIVQVCTFLAELDCWKPLQFFFFLFFFFQVSRLNWCILCAGRLRTRQLSGVRVWKKSWTTTVRVFVLLFWILPS